MRLFSVAASDTSRQAVRRRAVLLAALALAAGMAPPALAQDPTRVDTTGMQDPSDTTDAPLSGPRFTVSPGGGYQWFGKSAALNNSPFIGLRIGRGVLGDNRPFNLTIGLNAAFAMPTTRGDYFPWNRQIYANATHDTTLIFSVSQRVSMATFGGDVGVEVGVPGLTSRGARAEQPRLEASIGAGLYTFFLDPEQTRQSKSFSGPSITLGGGVAVPFGGNTALRVRMDDMIFLSFDRDEFSLSDPLFAETLFDNTANVPPKKSTVHNPRLSVVFSFVPGATK